MKPTVTLILILFSGFTVAADVGIGTQKEVEHLFDYLKQSNCQFERNGSWFGTDKAAQHIDKKYQYLLKKKAIRSAEDFIDHAASRSSTTEQPYRVDCGKKAVVETAVWFRADLDAFRK